jgi:AcrR family transcriptional regulator
LTAVIEERRYSSRLSSEPFEVDPSAPVAERLRAVFRVFWSGTLEEDRVLRLLLGEALRHEPAALPPGSALLEVFRSGVVMALAQHVPEVEDPGSISELYVAQIFSAFVRHVFEPDGDPAVIGERNADVVVRAVLGHLDP